jgi:hypothetical protein
MSLKKLIRLLTTNIDPCYIKNREIDLIISGGAFNVSYLVGCLYFIHEMREKGLIVINKISTCSASSLIGLLFLIDKVDLFVDTLYELSINSFKKNKHVIFDEESLANIINIIEKELPENILSIVNERLYITYYDVLECKQIIKNNYTDVNDIFNTIKRSCFIPYITMNKLLEDNKYIDGGTPYIFDKEEGVKRLYINLCGIDKIMDSIIIKKDKINTHRVLNGVLDIHDFFFRCKKTSMCSYVDNWSIIRKIEFKILKMKVYSLCLIIYFIIIIKSSVVDKYYKDSKIINSVFNRCRTSLSRIIEQYCI